MSVVQVRAPPEVLQNSNDFRSQKCYTARVDAELRKYQSSLRALFDVYAKGNKNQLDELQSSTMLSIGEWLSFLEHMGLLEMNQLTLFGAKMVFKWSLIRTLQSYSAASELKLRNLFFEDFLEALVRVACAMALPLDDEIAESGAADAGEYQGPTQCPHSHCIEC